MFLIRNKKMTKNASVTLRLLLNFRTIGFKFEYAAIVLDLLCKMIVGVDFNFLVIVSEDRSVIIDDN